MLKTIMRYRGLLAVLAALMLAYPLFLFGTHIGDVMSELPQDFREHPLRMIFGFALNVLIVGVVTWATCIRKRPVDPRTNS